MELTLEENGVLVFEDDAQQLVVNITDGGIVMVAYNNDPNANNDGQPVGTKAMTFDEWWNYLAGDLK